MKSWIELALPGAAAYASSLVGDRAQGEDIVQDCVCRLLGNAARYDLPRDGRKLLFRAITNASINHHTRGHKTVSLDRHGRQSDSGAWSVVDAHSPQPPSLAMAEELRRAIADGLQTLPLRQRSALELSSLGYEPHEIGEMLGVKYERVRVILFRARKTMAGFLNARFSGGVAP